MKLLLPLLVIAIIGTSLACDIILHVKSMTDKKFQAQVTAPNGQKSTKWSFSKKAERQTFQEKADVCGLGDFHIITFDSNGKQLFDEKVTLNGIGRVDYEVSDDFKPVQTYRTGATCSGQCAPLGQKNASPASSRASTPTQQ